MSTKKVLADQLTQYAEKLRKSCHASVSDQWASNKTLKTLFTKFCENILPKNPTRTIFMQMFDTHVMIHPSDPESWIQYLQTYQYCDPLISNQRMCATNGQRIDGIFERHPDLKIDSVKLAAEPQGVLLQKTQLLNDSKHHTDTIFKSVLTVQQQDEYAYTCSNPKCGARGYIKNKSQQVRKGDEPNTILEKCLVCGEKLKH